MVGALGGRPARRLFLAATTLAALLAAACDSSGESEVAAARTKETSAPALPPANAEFDFYVLSLSWSPSYCEAEGEDANRQQCRSGRPYAFVVHGLWPQFERGYPQNCPAEQRDVPRQQLSGLYDLMPSAGLIRHQWRKHGSCSGLDQSDYFAVLRKAREKVAVPAEFARLEQYRTVAPSEVEQSFLQSNSALPADGIAVTCDRRFLREVRICMTQDLQFRSCPEVDHRSCKLSKAVMPPVRGG